ncbi:MAG: hypothetical protein MRZ79_13205 [Bacteroidia bacterium]|nr:hypothetical protein [Bacteroidia bacterium]
MKFSNLKISLPLLALVTMMFSCVSEPSSDVSQDSIFAEYRLVYSSDDDKTYARADFKLGSTFGTKLQLTSPADVTIDGSSMAFKALFGYYERDLAGVAPTGEFEYTDLDGSTFVNQVIAAKSIDLPATLAPLKKGSSYTLSWVGDALGTDETITVTVNGPNEGDAKVFSTTDPGATSIILSADKINGLGVGLGRIIIERFHRQTLQEGTSKGGETWARYFSKTENIDIQP